MYAMQGDYALVVQSFERPHLILYWLWSGDNLAHKLLLPILWCFLTLTIDVWMDIWRASGYGAATSSQRSQCLWSRQGGHRGIRNCHRDSLRSSPSSCATDNILTLIMLIATSLKVSRLVDIHPVNHHAHIVTWFCSHTLNLVFENLKTNAFLLLQKDVPCAENHGVEALSLKTHVSTLRIRGVRGARVYTPQG